MHILYTDESEIYPHGDSHARYFVLVGVSVFERQIHRLSEELDKIAARFNVAEPQSVELHGSLMFGGKKQWRRQPHKNRIDAIQDVLHVLANSASSNRVFAIVVDKNADVPPMEYAFQQLATRFDYYLGRISHRRKIRQTGLILFDKSAHEYTLQAATTVYKGEGHQWGRIKYLAGVPAFIDSKSSRLIQLADIVAYAINHKIARNDDRFYQIIQSRFDSYEGKTHGLHIKTGVNGG